LGLRVVVKSLQITLLLCDRANIDSRLWLTGALDLVNLVGRTPFLHPFPQTPNRRTEVVDRERETDRERDD
jgi:hypothetical protein